MRLCRLLGPNSIQAARRALRPASHQPKLPGELAFRNIKFRGIKTISIIPEIRRDRVEAALSYADLQETIQLAYEEKRFKLIEAPALHMIAGEAAVELSGQPSTRPRKPDRHLRAHPK